MNEKITINGEPAKIMTIANERPEIRTESGLSTHRAWSTIYRVIRDGDGNIQLGDDDAD